MVLIVGCATNKSCKLFSHQPTHIYLILIPISFVLTSIALIAKILNHKFATTMGKLTYVVYLTHVSVIKFIYGRVRQPFYMSVAKIVR